jgi:hypothetical protein
MQSYADVAGIRAPSFAFVGLFYDARCMSACVTLNNRMSGE